MPKPQNKSELLKQSQERFDLLLKHIDSLSDEDKNRTFPSNFLNRNIRDVLGHLHEWHLMSLIWEKAGREERTVAIPAPGFTWRTIPKLNLEIRSKYSMKTLEEVRILLLQSHSDMINCINLYKDEELFEKKKFAWTGSTSVGAYLTSATWSHYHWALKLIKKCLK